MGIMNVYPLDCNDVFISTHNQNLSNCAFKYMQYADYNSLNPFKKNSCWEIVVTLMVNI